MFITSMGIYGFLSKAHIDQMIITGDNSLEISTIQSRIDREQRIIDDANKLSRNSIRQSRRSQSMTVSVEKMEQLPYESRKKLNEMNYEESLIHHQKIYPNSEWRELVWRNNN
jgi:hypothetical protein